MRTVFLEVDENNEPALRLYHRAGFREVVAAPELLSAALRGKPQPPWSCGAISSGVMDKARTVNMIESRDAEP